jgi:CHAT domain-containing protein
MDHAEVQRVRSLNSWLALFFSFPALVLISSIASSNGTWALSQQEDKEKPITLEIGKESVRDLAGGQTHSYAIQGVVGQYVEVVVEQREVDLQLTIFAPDGEKLIDVSSKDDPRRRQSASIIMESHDFYRLEVHSPSVPVLKGEYKLSLAQAHPATERDRSCVSAQAELAEARRLIAQGRPELLRSAGEKYERALALYRRISHREGETIALRGLGIIHNELGEMKRALDSWNIELGLRQEFGDRAGEADALLRIADIYNYLGYRQQALDFNLQALALYKADGNLEGQDVAQTRLAEVYVSTGEKQKALDLYKKSLAFRQSINDRRGEAVRLSEIGFILSTLGDLRKALDYLSRALPIHRSMGNSAGEAYALLSLGGAYVRLGESQKALDCYHQALSLHRAMGSRRGEAYALHNLAWAYDSIGEKRKSLQHNQEALVIMRDIEDRSGQAYILQSIGLTYRSLGKKQEALERCKQALELRRATGDRAAETESLYELARIERDLGSLTKALPYVESAINIADSLRAKLVSHELRASYQATIQNFYEFYIDLLFQLNGGNAHQGVDALAFQISERNRARSLLDLLTEARIEVRQGVDARLLERERALQQIITARTDSRIRLLGSKHSEEQAVQATKELESLTVEYQDVEAEIRATSPRYAALTQPLSFALCEIQKLLDHDTILLEYALGNNHSYLWAVSADSIKWFELDKRAVIEDEAKHVCEVLTARSKKMPNESAAERTARVIKADVEYVAASEKLSRILLAPVASEIRHKRLLIVSDGALQYVPFAALPEPRVKNHRAAGKPLILDHEIVNLPSASTLVLLRQDLQHRKSPPRTVAVIADPVFEATDVRVKQLSEPKATSNERPSNGITKAINVNEDQEEQVRAALRDRLVDSRVTAEEQPLARLPYTRKEATAIGALVPDPTKKRIILDFDANYGAATSPELAEFRFVHFATHGVLDSEQPELSGILLSLVDETGGRQQKGILRLGEIYNLKLPVDMMVLSGCQTALGKQMRGEGLIGLTRGFMYAGAPRVLASLWNVNDLATAELMKAFYEGILGEQLRPAEALRRAQIEMWRKPNRSAPYFWGAFVLQGEWR